MSISNRLDDTTPTMVAALKAPSPADLPAAKRAETLLVVDDEPNVRLLITDILEELGYSVLAAANGAAGLAVLRAQSPIDLLITDIGLPGEMSGQQLADAARVSQPNLKVLFITGYAESASIGGGGEAGTQVLVKPFAMDDLVKRIADIIAAP